MRSAASPSSVIGRRQHHGSTTLKRWLPGPECVKWWPAHTSIAGASATTRPRKRRVCWRQRWTTRRFSGLTKIPPSHHSLRHTLLVQGGPRINRKT